MRLLSISVLGLIGLLGCANDPQIVYPLTAAYERRVRQFKLSPDAACQALEGGSSQSAGCGFSGPNCIIDDWYLFSIPYKYARIDLTGNYVNGMTGKIEHRESNLSLFDNSKFWPGMFYPAGMPHSLSAARVYR